MIVTINDINIEIQRKKIRTIRMTIYQPEKRVRVSAPYQVSDKIINDFIQSKMNWIEKNLKRVNNQALPSNKYETGEQLYYKGVLYKFNLIADSENTKVEIEGTHSINLYISEKSSQKERELVMLRWYKDELNKTLIPLIEEWENKLDVKIQGFSIRKMKTLWGSCNRQTKHIHFNLELIKKPIYCIEYVVIHELIHIHIRLHNKDFYEMLKQNLPNWKEIEKELK